MSGNGHALTRDTPSPGARPCVVVLAAGASRRFGDTDKLLAPVDGQRLLELVLDRVLAAAAPEDVLVVVAPDAPQRAALARAREVRVVVAEHAGRGMRWSIQAGIDAAPDDSAGVALLLGDDPLAADALADVLATAARLGHASAVAVRRDPPVPHPVYLPAALLRELPAPQGDDDAGLRGLWGAEAVHWIEGTGPEPVDVDVHADLARLQRRLDDRP